MPKPRLSWFKVWVGATRHEKVATLDDRTFRIWVELLDAASQQQVRGRFPSYAAAAAVVRRPVASIRRLAQARLLDDREDGVWLHDWPDWQRWHPDDSPTNDTGITPESHANDSPSTQESHTIDTRGGVSARRGRGRVKDVDVEEEYVPPLVPPSRGGKHTREVLSADSRVELVTKWTDAYGGDARVQDEIDAALNHTSSLKCKSERLYVDRWLRRGIEEFASKRRTNPPHQDGAPFDAVCLCAELKDRLTRYPTAHAYCEVHGDVRQLA
jgi:hypothetical protein